MPDLNRRDLLKAFGSAAVAVGVAVGLPRWRPAPTHGYVVPWGPMTIERHRALTTHGIHIHVFHRDRDITLHCRFADDTGDGYAHVFLKNAEGRSYVDPTTGHAAMAVVKGITMREGDPFHA